jgi:hypothetical protein
MGRTCSQILIVQMIVELEANVVTAHVDRLISANDL